MSKTHALLALVLALLVGVVAGYVTIWGYLGLFMGEPTYRHEGSYQLMLGGGALATLASLAIIVRSIVLLVSKRSR